MNVPDPALSILAGSSSGLRGLRGVLGLGGGWV